MDRGNASDGREPAMEQLEYETARAKPAGTILRGIPCFMFVLTLFVIFHNGMEEPFGILSFEDIIIQVGGTSAIIIGWIVWFLIAARNKTAIPTVLLIACWAASNVWIAQWLLIGFFNEPWNH